MESLNNRNQKDEEFLLDEAINATTGDEFRDLLLQFANPEYVPDTPEAVLFTENFTTDEKRTLLTPKLPIKNHEFAGTTVIQFTNFARPPNYQVGAKDKIELEDSQEKQYEKVVEDTQNMSLIPILEDKLNIKQDPPSIVQKPFGTHWESLKNLETPYSYEVYTYTNGPEIPESGRSDEQFVCTGDGKGTVTNVFIPLKELQIRICHDDEGDEDEEEEKKMKKRKEKEMRRLKAYLSDFLTFLNMGKEEIIVKKHGKPLLLHKFNGSHLMARNDVGEVGGGVKLLQVMFSGKKARQLIENFQNELLVLDSKSSTNVRAATGGKTRAGTKLEFAAQHDLIAFIFRKWCHIVKLAAGKPAGSFDVRARFWHVKKGDSDPKFKFIHIIDNINGEVWSDALKKAHQEVRDQMKPKTKENSGKDEPLYPQMEIWGWHEIFRIRKQLVYIGAHPQLFYTTWVTKADAFEMQMRGYLLERHRFFDTSFNVEVVEGFKADKRLPSGNIEDSKTSVSSINKVTIGSVHGRSRGSTQLQTMGISATEIAKKVFAPGATKEHAEWLHRCAQSFGSNVTIRRGNNEVKKNSMAAENLVFGTHETNTEMIRYEDYLKRLAIAWDFTVTLKTTLMPSPLYGNSPLWFVENLGYEWEFEPPGSNVKISRPHEFDLFSRRRATRYEADLDRCFDKLWFPYKKQGTINEEDDSKQDRDELQKVIFDFASKLKRTPSAVYVGMIEQMIHDSLSLSEVESVMNKDSFDAADSLVEDPLNNDPDSSVDDDKALLVKSLE